MISVRLIMLAVLTYILSGCGVFEAFLSSDDSMAPTVSIPLSAENYTVVYDGEGQVSFNTSDITMAPKSSTSGAETHAALVLLKQTVDVPLRDFELTVDLQVPAQLRQNTSPNDWEVFWLFFGHNGTPTEKTTNYFISKPGSGAELGLAQGELGQKFIATDGTAKTAVSERHVFKYIRKDDTFQVYRDGNLFYSYSDATAFPQKLFSGKGSLGFYTEDAQVKIFAVSLKRLDSSRTPASTSVTPVLTSASPMVVAPGDNSSLKITASNIAQTGNLFWSCTFKKIFGDMNGVSNQDCKSLGVIDDDSTLRWTPSFTDVGTWFVNFEASEIFQGFTKKTAYVQIRPSWSSGALFLYDPQFSISKTVEGQNVLAARDTSGSENTNAAQWPALTGTDAVDLSGLSEASPWLVDSTTQTGALHFDANQDINGLPLSVSNLGTTKDLRVSYWFKRDNTDSKTAVLVNHSNGTLQSRHWLGVISTSYTDGGSETTCDDPSAALSDWMFVTSQVESGVLKTYVNGRKVCSQNLSTTYNFASPLRIGPKVQTFYPFAGRLSEIAGYTHSTESDVFNDFLNSADRYRSVKIGPVLSSGVILHLDAANADRGMYLPAATPANWFDLGPTAIAKVFGNFNGNASSGFVTSTPSSSSMTFDGTDDYVQIPATAELSLGTTWTIEAWLQPGNPLGYDTNYPVTDVNYPLFKTVFEKAFFDNANKLSHGIGLRIGPTNTVDAFVVNNYGLTETVQGTTNLTPNQWYHVAVSFNKTTSQLKSYVNGALESTKTINYKLDSGGVSHADGDILNGLSNAYMGIPFDADGRRRFNGKIGVLRVYQNTLSDSQIKSNCMAQKNRFSVSCN